jgi:hypothetical protein
MVTTGFDAEFLGTDGDTSMDKPHRELFELYKSARSLSEACAGVEHAERDFGGRKLAGWVAIPTSDLLHLLKAIRWRIVTHLTPCSQNG